MKKAKKIILWIVIVFVVLIGALIATPFLFKDKIIAIVKTEINKQVQGARVDFGDIDLSLLSSFPDFRVQLKNLHVQNDSTFANTELLSVDEISIDINLMSVLKGDSYEVNSIDINTPKIHTLILASGKANYDIMKTDSSAVQDSSAKTKETTSSDTASAKYKIQLKNFTIRHANILYEDKKTGDWYALKEFNFTLAGDLAADRTDLSMQLGIDQTTIHQTGVSYLKNAKFTMDMDVDADLANKKYTLKKNNIQLNALQLNIEGWVQQLTQGFDMDVKLGVPAITLKNVLSLVPALYTKDYKDMVAQGAVALAVAAKGVYNDKRVPAFHVDFSVKNGEFKYPSLPKPVKNINIDLKVSNTNGVLDNTLVNLANFHADLADNPIDASLKLTNPISDPNVAAKVKGKIDLSSVKDFVPSEELKDLKGRVTADVQIEGTKSMIDKKQYQKFHAEGNFMIEDVQYYVADYKQTAQVKELSLFLSPQKVQLRNLDAHIGNSDVQAQGVVANFLAYLFGSEGSLKGDFKVASKTLDLNQFMASSTDVSMDNDTKTEATKTQSAEDSAASAPMSIIELPARINFNLALNVANVLYDSWHIKDMVGKIALRDRKAEIDGLRFGLLDALFQLKGSYSTREFKKPKVDFNTHISNLDIQKALVAFPIAGKFGSFSKECFGIVGCDIAFNTTLNDTMSPIFSTLNADGTLRTKSIALRGETTEKIMGLITRKKQNDLAIKDLNLQFAIRGGVLTLKPFDLNMGEIKGTCNARYDLQGTVDMNYNARVPFAMIEEVLENQFKEVGTILNTARDKGIMDIIPDNVGVIIAATGAATKPDMKLKIDPSFVNELKSNVENAVKQALNKAKDQLVNEAKKRAEQELNKQKEQLQKEADKQKNKLLDEGKKRLKDILKF